VNGFYHRNFHQNEVLKNKKNACGHRNQKRNFSAKIMILRNKKTGSLACFLSSSGDNIDEWHTQ
ncbi:hypothetical protein, partial [Bacillus pumilus]|uniref:hypothetical protein n=1 Tax=Bacillus pumilus TaxID=1408 RepID=UPI001C92C11D